MINKQRVKRIKNVIYTVMILLVVLPVVLLVALGISMINMTGFMRGAADSLNRIENYIAEDAGTPSGQSETEAVTSPDAGSGGSEESGGVILEPDDGAYMDDTGETGPTDVTDAASAVSAPDIEGQGLSPAAGDGASAPEQSQMSATVSTQPATEPDLGSPGQEAIPPVREQETPSDADMPPATSAGDSGEAGEADYGATYSPVPQTGARTAANSYKPADYPELFFDTLPIPREAAGNTLYLTIDNTPSENFSDILAVLDKYDVPATFFVWKSDSASAGSAYRALLEAGHAIGIHSGDPSIPHSALYADAGSFLADFAEMFRFIEAQTGVRTRLYRLPGGSVQPDRPERRAVLEKIGEELENRGFVGYDWTASADDAVIPPLSTQQILANLHTDISSGDRVTALIHDGTGSDSTVRALEEFIPYCLEAGFTFRAIDNNAAPVSSVSSTESKSVKGGTP